MSQYALIDASGVWQNTIEWYGWFSQIAIWPSCNAAQMQKYSKSGSNLKN